VNQCCCQTTSISDIISVRDPRENCRLCNCNFKIRFGNIACPGKKGYLSSENIFIPSQRKDSFGVVLADICKEVGLPLVQDAQYSDKVCNPCGRKLRNLGSLFRFLKGSQAVTCKTVKTPEKPKHVVGKRLLETPDKRSPSWRQPKQPCTRASPSRSSRKSLGYGDDQRTPNAQYDSSSSYLNIDDLPKEGLQIKVLILHPNGNVSVRIPREEESKKLVKKISLCDWKAASKLLIKHQELMPELQLEF